MVSISVKVTLLTCDPLLLFFLYFVTGVSSGNGRLDRYSTSLLLMWTCRLHREGRCRGRIEWPTVTFAVEWSRPCEKSVRFPDGTYSNTGIMEGRDHKTKNGELFPCKEFSRVKSLIVKCDVKNLTILLVGSRNDHRDLSERESPKDHSSLFCHLWV